MAPSLRSHTIGPAPLSPGVGGSESACVMNRTSLAFLPLLLCLLWVLSAPIPLKLSGRGSSFYKPVFYKPVYQALEHGTPLAKPLRWYFRLWGIRFWDARTGKEVR